MKTCCFYLLLLLALPPLSLKGQNTDRPDENYLTLDLEGGLIATGYNDVQIPGKGGTRFSFPKQLDQNGTGYFRIRGNYTINDRHTISALFAPLTVKYEGVLDKPVDFFGKTFGDRYVRGNYKFNSYRLTYRYHFISRPRLLAGIGITAKIRDASIELSDGSQSSKKSNFGFVPLLNFYIKVLATPKIGILLEGDALATNQGRAEDIFLGATYNFNKAIGLKAGYRILEGGADNDEVYNFSLFNYLALGAVINF